MSTQDRNCQQFYTAGALLVHHGLNGSQGDMEELTDFLANYGIVGLNVFLPGRGTNIRERLAMVWLEWSSIVRKELHKLKQWYKDVFLIGHTLGGSLSLHIAASESIAGIVTMSTPVYMYPWMFPTAHWLKHFAPGSPKLRADLRGDEASFRYKSDVYSSKVPAKSMLHYLPSLQTELPTVTAPALILTATHDDLVPASDARAIYRSIGSQEKYLVKFRRSHHLLMKGDDREEVFARTLEFIQSHRV
jgi:carboxylesterase